MMDRCIMLDTHRIALSLHHNILKSCGVCNGGNPCEMDKYGTG